MVKSKSELRVVVIGGGIGGAAAAVALHNAGFKAHVYEQAREIREVGAGIGLRPPTIRFFEKWGLLNQIERVTHLSDYLEVLSEQGDLIIEEKWPVLTEDPNERYARLIHRADCLETLVNAIPKGYHHLNHRCVNITKYDGYAVVEFANGKKVEADLVVAADGIRSLTRSLFFSKNEPVFHHYHAYRALVNEVETFGLHSESRLSIFVNKNVNLYLLPLKYRKQVSVDLTVPSEDASWRPDVTKEEMLEHLTTFHPDLQRIIENIDDFDRRSLYDIDPVDTWTNDCIALIGDAAHAMLHNQGQGANTAIQDGGTLAECLLEADSVAEALQKYEKLRKPVCQQLQEVSRNFYNEQQETAFPEKEIYEKVAD